MVRKLALAGAVALLTAGAASAQGGATAVLSNSSPGARNVGLTIVLRVDELQCGRLRARSLTLTLPRAMQVPSSIPVGAGRVSGQRVTAVRAHSGTILLSLGYPKGVICDSIGPGTVRIQLAPAAGLGNPVRAGTYSFAVTAQPSGDVWHGTFAVRS